MRSTMIIAVLITMSVMYTSATPLFGFLAGGSSGASGGESLATASTSVLHGALGGVVKGVAETGSGLVHTATNVLAGTAGAAGTVLSVPAVAAELVVDGLGSAVGVDQPKTTTVVEKTIIL